MKWITRERPKTDRIACPWLIRNFADPEAEFIYVPTEQVFAQARKLNAVPFDIPHAEYSHEGEICTFDTIVRKHHLSDPALLILAQFVRGADTDRFDIAPQAAGLWAISAGLSHNIKDDHEMLRYGMILYDALSSQARHAQSERHNWNPDLKV